MSTLSRKLSERVREVLSHGFFKSEEELLSHALDLAEAESKKEQAALNMLSKKLAPALAASDADFVAFDLDAIKARYDAKHAKYVSAPTWCPSTV